MEGDGGGALSEMQQTEKTICADCTIMLAVCMHQGAFATFPPHNLKNFLNLFKIVNCYSGYFLCNFLCLQ